MRREGERERKQESRRGRRNGKAHDSCGPDTSFTSIRMEREFHRDRSKETKMPGIENRDIPNDGTEERKCDPAFIKKIYPEACRSTKEIVAELKS